MRTIGLLAAACFVGTVVAANWALDTFGIVQIAPGLYAPAGVFFAGLAFLLRDLVQRILGRAWVLGAIAIGGAVSVLVDPTFALASSMAFLVSELADFAVYTRLERRGFLGAVIASNVVGAVVDSALFLWIAFGSLDFIEGQIVGKLLVTIAALPFLVLARRRLSAA